MPDERASDQGLGTIEAEFRAWLSAHPAATLTELEMELDRASRGRVVRRSCERASRSCRTLRAYVPIVAGPLVAHGQHVQPGDPGDEPLTVERSYQRCPACGAQLFPWMRRQGS